MREKNALHALRSCLRVEILKRANYLCKTSMCMRQSFVLDTRRHVHGPIDEANRSIIPMASAPQTTHRARGSSDARMTSALERCGGSLSIQLFNKITFYSLCFRMLRRFFLPFSSSFSLSVYLFLRGIMCTQLHSLGRERHHRSLSLSLFLFLSFSTKKISI